MEAASPRRHPDLFGDRMAINDDLAVIGKLDFQHATSTQFEIQIGLARLQRRLDPPQHLVGQAVEILVIHRATIPLFADSVPTMSRIAALLIILGLAACGMREHVVILGKKANPYPYMAACGLYVQPSRYEGRAVAVREAQILGRPVAITNFPTSAGHLEDGVDGIIIPNDEEGAALALFRLLKDDARLESLSEECRRRDYGNRDEILKLEALI